MRGDQNKGLQAPTPGASQAPAELKSIQPFAMGGPQVLEKLNKLGRDVVSRNVPGDFVECGVCNGGSAAAISNAFRDSPRKAWLYDSFEGLPPARAEVDGPDAPAATGLCLGSEAKAREAMRLARFPEANIVVRKGWFADSFKLPLPAQVALLHIDADWYDSVLLSLRTFYDLVSEGGTIVLDDFGHWEGCREAFYDFAAERRLKPLLERFGHTQAFWVKGRTHNRDFLGKWEIP